MCVDATDIVNEIVVWMIFKWVGMLCFRRQPELAYNSDTDNAYKNIMVALFCEK